MNLLVTGGAGFIGSNLIRSLIEEPRISRLVNLDALTYAGHLASLNGLPVNPNYFFEKVDLRDKPSLGRIFREHAITHVLHLAAESHVDRSIAQPADFVTTNILGTFNLLETCREVWLDCSPAHRSETADCRFLHVSTDEVYGSLGASGSFTESSPYSPNSPYSASKAASDLLVRACGRTYGLNVVITNCSNNYGPYQFPEKLIPVVIQNLIHRRPIPIFGDGLHVRDWLHVQDHTEALWKVLLHGAPGESYNIGGQNEWTNLRVVQLLCDLFDEVRPRAGGNSRSLITFVQDRPGHDRRYAMNGTRIERELGWSPSRRFEEGIRETLHWYLDNQSWAETVLAEAKARWEASP